MTDIVERLRGTERWHTPLPEMLDEAADEIERLRALSQNNAHSWDAIVKERDALRAALEPFAEVARWAERNGHDLVKDFDMLLRGPGKEFAGHLQAQAPAFIAAAAALNIQQRPEPK